MFNNIVEIIGIIIEVIILIFIISKIYNEYRLYETIDEKVIFFLIMFIVLIPILIYCIDIYNLPSKFNLFKNSNSKNWFNFITTYISSIFGAIIGAVALVLMTIHQMKRQDEKDRETLRINIMPLLSYEISKNKGTITPESFFITNCKRGYIVDFELKIKNLGMNAIKKASIRFSSDDFDASYYYWLADRGSIDKNDYVTIYRCLKISKGVHKINATVYYCDLINNWYSQNIIISLDVTNLYDKNGCIYNPTIMIENEKIMNEEPKESI